MPGSLTTPGRPGARDNALGCVAFHNLHSVGTQNRKLSRLNGWPMRPPVNASPRPSRATAHDSGPMWIATLSSQRDLHPLLLAGLPAHANVFRFEQTFATFRCSSNGDPPYHSSSARIGRPMA